jgi:hypothetical protein
LFVFRRVTHYGRRLEEMAEIVKQRLERIESLVAEQAG